MKVTAPTVSRYAENRDTTIGNIINVFYKNQPRWKVEYLFNYVKKVRSALNHPKGFTEGKDMLRVAEIPKKIYYMMNYAFGQEWRNDEKIMRSFLQQVKALRVNETTTPMTNPDWQDDKRDTQTVSPNLAKELDEQNILAMTPKQRKAQLEEQRKKE